MSTELRIDGIVDAVPIGRGGFATVYRARQPAFGRTVAVKVITGATADPRARARFERECRSMGALSDHPGIVTVHDAGVTTDGDPYLVMAHQAGGSLRQRLNTSGAVGWRETVRVGLQVAGALGAAHELGIVHRDVKPANLLVSAYGGVQLADFGIARIAGGPETRTDQVMATLQYAPPEVLAGKGPTAVGDLYALGATLFELAIGSAAFTAGPDEPPAALMARVLHDPIPDLRTHDVPDDLAALVTATMAKDPSHRPHSARALSDALAAVVQAHHLDVTDAGPGPSAAAAAAPGPGEAETVATATASHDGWQEPTVVTPPAPFEPSHLVPKQGLAAWTTPDGRYPAPAVMDPALPVQLLRWWGDWAEVRCSNGWVAWVNGRDLVPAYR